MTKIDEERTKKFIINNLKSARRQMKKSADDDSWKYELIWIEDAIRYLEELK